MYKSATINIILLILIAINAYSQPTIMQLSVASFNILTNDMDARINHPKQDRNGEKCAIIKVVTTETGFTWEGGGLGIIDVESKIGEYWLYVPYGAKKLTIKHDKYGVLKDYMYPAAIQKATVYELVLTTGKVTTIIEKAEIKSNWLIVTSEPSGADVYIDDNYRGQTPYNQHIRLGEHSYRISKEMHNIQAGKFEIISEDEKKELHIILSPIEDSKEKITGTEQENCSLIITSKPESGASIFMDEKKLDKQTPYTINNLLPGEHTITIKKDWFTPLKKLIVIQADETKELNLTLIPAFGEVSITTEPEADIYIDKQELRFGNYSGRLSAGLHIIEAKKDSLYDSRKIEIFIGDNKQIELKPYFKTGSLKVVSQPFAANILLNKTNYGITPRTIDQLPIGEYNLLLVKPGCDTIQKQITIKENELTEINEKLKTEKKISINSDPPGAEISIDGKNYGKTPQNLSLPFGEHSIKILKGDYYLVKSNNTLNIISNKDTYTYNLKIKKRFFVSYTGSITLPSTEFISPVGIQIGYLGKPGMYFSLRLNTQYNIKSDYIYENDEIIGFKEGFYYEFNDNTKYPSLIATGGLIFRLVRNVNLYTGVGYGYNKTLWQISEYQYPDTYIEDKLVENVEYSITGIAVEAGLMYRGKRLLYNIGYSTLAFKNSAVVLGTGLYF
ncbi:PEGA domain-containing protein [Bacteroidota bacterium]